MAHDKNYRNRSWLQRHYVDHNKSIAEIASMDECDADSTRTIHKWLDKHDIETDDTGDTVRGEPNYRDKSWLREQYIDNELSAAQIVALDECECESEVTIRQQLNRHGIERRAPGDAKRVAESGPNTAINGVSIPSDPTDLPDPERSRAPWHDPIRLDYYYRQQELSVLELAEKWNANDPETIRKQLRLFGLYKPYRDLPGREPPNEQDQKDVTIDWSEK
jgi:hypothetical protein